MGIFSRNKDHNPPPYSVDDYDDEFEDEAPPQQPWRTELPPNAYAQPRHRQPEPRPEPPITAEDLGRITAEAIKIAHEQASKALEALGEEIQQRVLRIEALKLQAIQQIADCKELAEQHREAGNHMSTQVEMAATDLNEAKFMIEEMRRKVMG